jgi:thiosulfate/3-mercaptopyruvate sulfurtransferase
MFSAPRVWWTLQVFGHRNVSVLNGGLPAWKRVGGALETGPPKEYKIRTYPVPEVDLRLVRSFEDMTALVEGGDKAVRIIDARSEDRFVTLSEVLILFRFLGRAPEPRPGLVLSQLQPLMNRFGIWAYPRITICTVSKSD